jgi:1,4-dihydroxy-2-naphthoate octaprenyltransferase
MNKLKAWVEASRPRMLTLGLSSGLVPGALAYRNAVFDLPTLVMELLLTTGLLIVSCWADEYGDLKKGVDNNNRLGPIRPVQRGEISLKEILIGTLLGSAACFALGTALTLYSFLRHGFNLAGFIGFIVVGIICILATWGYTMGKRPYGYIGLGDISAYFFFGIVAGVGGYFLYAHTMDMVVLLPMTSVGLLFVSTINLQNIRDFDNDFACKKYTTAIVLGRAGAIRYQFVLVVVAALCYLSTPVIFGLSNPLNYLFAVTMLPFIVHLIRFYTLATSRESPAKLDLLMWPLTRSMGLTALLFSVCICL